MPSPFPFQRNCLAWLNGRPRAIVALEQGLGKTVVAALDLKVPALVICTSSMKYRWQYELSIWRPELKTQVIDTVKTKIDWSCQVWIINYDIVWKYALPLPHTLIVDESHKVKSPEAKRSLSVLSWTDKAQRVRFLSGTPMPNRPIELFPILEKIHSKVRRMGWYGYVMRFCDAWRMPWNRQLNVQGASNLEELCDLTADVMIRMTKAEVASDLPPKTYRIIELDGVVTEEEDQLWLEFEKSNLILPINSIAFQAISDIRKIHARRKLPQCIEYIKDLLDSDEKMKVVVFAHHRESVLGLAEALSGYGAVKVLGGVKAKDVTAYVQAFQTDDSIRVFVGNIQSAGEGITLTRANHVVFVEPSWVPAEIAQAADRCHRLGQSLPVTVDLLTVQGSIDAKMLWSVLEKLDVINQVVKETKLMNYSKIAQLLRQLADEFDPAGAMEAEVVAEAEEVIAEKADKAEKAEKDPKAKKPTAEDVRAAASAAIAAGKRDKVIEILKNNGAGKLSELEEQNFGAVLKAIKALD